MIQSYSQYAFLDSVPPARRESVKAAWHEIEELREHTIHRGLLIPFTLVPQLLGVCSQRAYQIRNDGRLQVFKFCGKEFCTEDSILRFLNGNRTTKNRLKR